MLVSEPRMALAPSVPPKDLYFRRASEEQSTRHAWRDSRQRREFRDTVLGTGLNFARDRLNEMEPTASSLDWSREIDRLGALVFEEDG
jgi:hypothetical protein